MEQFTTAEKEEINDILTDITDLGYIIFFRTVDKGIFIYKYGGIDDDGYDIGVIDYDEIVDPLGEAVDRLSDNYNVEIQLSVVPHQWRQDKHSDRSAKYSEVPDSINFKCDSITLILSPKSKFIRIKNFLSFK